MISILMVPAELANLDLLIIKVFWHKGTDVIISIHDTTNNDLSTHLNYKVDVVMWPTCGYSCIFMRDLIKNSFEFGFGLGSIIWDCD